MICNKMTIHTHTRTFLHVLDGGGTESVLVGALGGPVVSLADTTRHHTLVVQLLEWVIISMLQLLERYTHTYNTHYNTHIHTHTYIYSTLRGRIKGTASAAFVIQNRFCAV